MTEESNVHLTDQTKNEPGHMDGGMAELYLNLGKLTERLESVPSAMKTFVSSFLGSAAVAALMVAIMLVWFPREIDGLKGKISDEITKAASSQTASISELSKKIDELNFSVSKQNAASGLFLDRVNRIENIVNQNVAQDVNIFNYLPNETLFIKLKKSAQSGDKAQLINFYSNLSPDQKSLIIDAMIKSSLERAALTEKVKQNK